MDRTPARGLSTALAAGSMTALLAAVAVPAALAAVNNASNDKPTTGAIDAGVLATDGVMSTGVGVNNRPWDERGARVKAVKPRAHKPAPRHTNTTASRSSTRAPIFTGDPHAIAASMVAARGWGSYQYNCLVSLWNRESGWNIYADNPGSGAYGIPQALPGSKMASAGADWRTNPATQIAWGLGYIASSYGTPCGALAHSNATGFY